MYFTAASYFQTLLYYADDRPYIAQKYGLIEFCCVALKENSKLSSDLFKLLTLIFIKRNSYFEEICNSNEWYVPEEEVNVEMVHHFTMKEGF